METGTCAWKEYRDTVQGHLEIDQESQGAEGIELSEGCKKYHSIGTLLKQKGLGECTSPDKWEG